MAIDKKDPLNASVTLQELELSLEEEPKDDRKAILKVFHDMDSNNDGAITGFEVDRNSNGVLDSIIEYSNRVSSAQFGKIRDLLNRHDFQIGRLNDVYSDHQRRSTASYTEAPSETISTIVPRRPDILEKFLNQNFTVNFVPEYQYKDFFYEFSDEYGAEHINLANLILKANEGTTVYFSGTNSSNFQNSPEGKLLIDTYGARVKFHEQSVIKEIWVDGEPIQPSLWAQDFIEPTGGQEGVLVTGWIPTRYEKREREQTISSLSNQELLFAPFVFQGGNLTKTVIHGKNSVIVGSDDYQETKLRYRQEYQYDISDDELDSLYKKAFGADQVIVLENSIIGFHIDQMTCFPSENKVIMPSILFGADYPDSPDHREFAKDLKKNRDTLIKAGFEIIDIPMTWSMIGLFQNFTNSIAISSTPNTHIIIPSFNEPELEEEIKRILTHAGYEVRFSTNTTYERQGNSHCITGMLR